MLKLRQNEIFKKIEIVKKSNQTFNPVFKCEDLKHPYCFKGKIPDSREIKKLFRAETATEAIGSIYPNCSIFGVTKGQFSLIELISVLLDQTGPAHLIVSTWTAAGADLNDAFALIESGKLLSVRFIVDHTFQRRQPAFAARIRELFGLDAIRVTRNHCKFSLIRNDKWNLVLKTSMNFNFNPRLENFDISDDVALAEFLQGIVDEIFNRVKKEAISDPIMVNEKRFESL